MLLLVLLSLSPFLQLSHAVGEAFIPPWTNTLTNTKNRRVVRALSAGRQVTISEENVKKMANVPLAYLSTSNATVRAMIVKIHNDFRRNVSPSAKNMLEMKWNDDAARNALEYAKKCIAGHSPASTRVIPRFTCGENLFLSSFKASWEDVITALYSECDDFEYGKGAKSTLEIRHFTQIVWATSCLIGCGMAECPNKDFRYNFVCQYCRAGNIPNLIPFPYKSGPPCGDCPSACNKGLCTNPCNYEDLYNDCSSYYHGQKCDASMMNDCPESCMCTNNEIR